MEATLIFWFDSRVKMRLSREMGPLCSLEAISHRRYFSKSGFDKSWIVEFKVVISGKNSESGYY